MVIYLILGLMYKFLGVKMSEYTKLLTKDDHHFEAFVTRPSHKVKRWNSNNSRDFGVNNHIKEVCKHYSKQGYLCISPCLFDEEQSQLNWITMRIV